MKVKIQKRKIYHKFVEVEVEIPNMKKEHIAEYLDLDEDVYMDKIDKAMYEAPFEEGFGDLTKGMEEKESEIEWRFEVPGFGGHL